MPTYADFGGWVISTIAGWFVVTADKLRSRLCGMGFPTGPPGYRSHPKDQIPPAGAFWSVTNYQDHFLVPNDAKKYSVNNWMNPKTNADGSIAIYPQPTSPGADLETNWLPTSASIPTPTPLMRLHWPLPNVFHGKWEPPPAVEVQ
jgi:hypothetical protein